MIRFKDISIPKPCSVDYDALPGDDVKHFCGSCDKYVYDFRGKDEGYFNDVFLTTGKVCGVFHEDQIQKPSLKVKRPFYYSIVTRLLSIGLLLKTILSSYQSEAANQEVFQTTQEANDSTGVKVEYKNRPYYNCNYELDIFINNILYRSKIKITDGTIYLPDTIKPNDNIKVIVKHTKIKMLMRNKIDVYTTRYRKYNFYFSESDNTTIKISYKKHLSIRKKRKLAGVPCGYW
jgi:hypothetical protein